jgi:hypothetical protein
VTPHAHHPVTSGRPRTGRAAAAVGLWGTAVVTAVRVVVVVDGGGSLMNDTGTPVRRSGRLGAG